MTDQEKIESLEKKMQQIKAQKRQLVNRQNALKRKNEMRKKVLTGAMTLHLVKNGKWKLDSFLSQMDMYLNNNSDRELFDLPPIDEK